MAAKDNLSSRLFNPGPAKAVSAPVASAGGGGSTLFDVAPYQAKPSAQPAAKSGGDFLKSNYQLPMFMTPREITSKYQALDADRYESYDEGTTTGYGSGGYDDPRAGEATYRSQRTDYGVNSTNQFKVRTSDPGYRRPKIPKEEGYRMETDEELYSRKYDEAEEAPAGGQHDEGRYVNPAGALTTSSYTYTRHEAGSLKSGYSTGGSWHSGSSRQNVASSSFQRFHANESLDPEYYSLADSIRGEGVKSPIRLGETIGSQGKPEIVGGHHRLSVAQFEAPDELVPVLHHTGIRSAKNDPVYKYT